MLNWLFVDLNSYFASVEQQLRPELRKKPVAVVQVLADSATCIAASYEAKRFGVKTGTMVAEAKRLCPQTAFVEANHESYIRFHEQIVQAVESVLPVTSVMSIDEMACRLTGRDRNTEHALTLAKEVKEKILKIGDQLTSSVGLAPNRLLAKIASDMQKPDGLTMIRQEDLPAKIFELKPRDFPGIGPRMEERLHKFGIRTVKQLYTLPMEQMEGIWGGVGGSRFYRWMRGEDFDIEHGDQKSIDHSHVLAPEMRTKQAAQAISQKLLQKAAVRLRKLNAWTAALNLSIQYKDGVKWKEHIRTVECQDTLTLMEALEELWRNAPSNPAPMKVAVTLPNLIPDHERTFSFFENTKRRELSKAMDSINAKFGKNTIWFGATHDVRTSAPTRIAFSSIPDLEL
jgi:DNA polymerase IV